MSNCHTGEPHKGRPFPIPVVTLTAEPDGPCPHTLHEQAREKLFPFYRLAALEVRNWRREAYLAGEQRKNTSNPVKWISASCDQLYAKTELHFAQKRLRVMANQLDNAQVNRFLAATDTAHKWEPNTPVPVCSHAATSQPRHSARTVAAVFTTAASVMFAQMGPELIAITPNQRLEAALAFGAICGTGGQNGGGKREALCHAAKLSTRRRLTLEDGPGTA